MVKRNKFLTMSGGRHIAHNILYKNELLISVNKAILGICNACTNGEV